MLNLYYSHMYMSSSYIEYKSNSFFELYFLDERLFVVLEKGLDSHRLIRA